MKAQFVAHQLYGIDHVEAFNQYIRALSHQTSGSGGGGSWGWRGVST